MIPFATGDLGHNIIVRPETLKANAITDWEFDGFCLEWLERPLCERDPGRDPALVREGDDSQGASVSVS